MTDHDRQTAAAVRLTWRRIYRRQRREYLAGTLDLVPMSPRERADTLAAFRAIARKMAAYPAQLEAMSDADILASHYHRAVAWNAHIAREFRHAMRDVLASEALRQIFPQIPERANDLPLR